MLKKEKGKLHIFLNVPFNLVWSACARYILYVLTD